MNLEIIMPNGMIIRGFESEQHIKDFASDNQQKNKKVKIGRKNYSPTIKNSWTYEELKFIKDGLDNGMTPSLIKENEKLLENHTKESILNKCYYIKATPNIDVEKLSNKNYIRNKWSNEELQFVRDNINSGVGFFVKSRLADKFSMSSIRKKFYDTKKQMYENSSNRSE